MPYEYEIFFSYKRNVESDAWHEKLKNKIKYWVGEEPDIDQVRVFFDVEEIQTGNRWREKIAEALRTSKCLVCILSPQYFRSKYCVAELLSFYKRSELMRTELIAPASRVDGRNFPPLAQEFQIKSFNNYFLTATRFWDTELAVEFEDRLIKPFARDVANLIRRAPPSSPDFPIIDAEGDLPPSAKLDETIRIGRIANAQ